MASGGELFQRAFADGTLGRRYAQWDVPTDRDRVDSQLEFIAILRASTFAAR